MRKKQAWLLAGVLTVLGLSVVLYIAFSSTREPAEVDANKPKVLILTLECSGGHAATSKAICQAMPSNIKCYEHFVDGHENFYFYELVMRHKLLRILYNVYQPFVWGSQKWSIQSALGTILRELKNNDYDALVCVLPGLTEVMAETIVGYNIPFIIIPTDLEDALIGQSWLRISRHWLDPKVPNSHYLLGTQRLYDQAIEVGINPSRIRRISGMPINQKFTSQSKSKAQLRKELGIAQDTQVVLFLFGSCGSTEMVDLMNIMDQHPQYHCIFICGKAKELKARLDGLNVNGKHQVLGFVTNVAELMTASDVVVGKPGPGVISECMACNVPIVVRSGIDVMLQERYNVDYIQELGVGEVVTDWNDLPEMLESMFENYSEYGENFKTIPKNNALQESVEFIKEVVSG